MNYCWLLQNRRLVSCLCHDDLTTTTDRGRQGHCRLCTYLHDRHFRCARYNTRVPAKIEQRATSVPRKTLKRRKLLHALSSRTRTNPSLQPENLFSKRTFARLPAMNVRRYFVPNLPTSQSQQQYTANTSSHYCLIPT